MNRACESAGDWILKIAVFLVCFGPKNEDADWISLLVAAVGFDFGHRQRLAGTSHGASRPRHEIPAAKIAPQERFLRGFESLRFKLTNQKRGIRMDTSFLIGSGGGIRTYDTTGMNRVL